MIEICQGIKLEFQSFLKAKILIELAPWYLECSVDAPVSQPRVLGKTVGDDLPLAASSALDQTVSAVPPGQDQVCKIVRLKT